MRRNLTVLISTLVIALTTTLGASVARAAPIDFNAIPDGNDPTCGSGSDTCNLLGSSYEEDGFRITSSGAGGIVSLDSNHTNYTGSKAIFPNEGTSALSLEAVGGLAFNFESITLSRLVLGNDGVTRVVFTGIKADGSPNLGRTFQLTQGSPVNQIVTFNGWDNLLSVSWNRTSGTGRQYDDIVVSTVPLPAAAPLFASAVSLLGFLGWRNRKS